MKLYASCMCCLLNKQEQKLKENQDESKKSQYMKEIMRLIGESPEDACAPWLASEIKKIHQKYFGVKEDFGPFKKKYNQLVLDKEKELEERICSSPDPLKTAIRYARVGNYIDYGAVANINEEEFFALFEKEDDILDEKEYQQFCHELAKASHMVYLMDNCGEIVLDKLVIKLLKQRFPHVEITAMVRGSDILNDATMEDAQMVGLTKLVKVVGNGDDVAGSILTRMSKEARGIVDQADVILAKGQGNFETLSGCGKNVYYSFLCKCPLFMKKFHANRFQGMFLNENRMEL